MSSYALDDLFADETLVTEQEKNQRDNIGEPVFDRPAHEWSPIHLAELLPDPDYQAAHYCAGHRGEAAQDEDRQCLQRDQRQAELHAALGAPHDAGHDGHQAGHRPDDDPDRLEGNADRQGGLVIVGDGAERAANARALEEDGEHGHQDGGGAGGGHLQLVHLDAGHHHRAVGDADVQPLDVGAPQHLAEPLEEEVQPDGRHEQDDLLLVDERPQHDPLDRERQRDHDRHRQQQRDRHRHALLHEADESQGGEQHHRALRKVEDAGRLEDE